jgi:NADH:ubiquinone oxidoreductase subunit K
VTTVAYLYLGAMLYAAGALGTLIRRSPAARVVGIELMLAGATLTFVAASAGFHELDGQVAALVVIGVGLAQGMVGFSLVATLARPE